MLRSRLRLPLTAAVLGGILLAPAAPGPALAQDAAPEQPPLEEVGPRNEVLTDAPRKVKSEIEKALEAWYAIVVTGGDRFRSTDRIRAMEEVTKAVGRLQTEVLKWNGDLAEEAKKKGTPQNNCLRMVDWWKQKLAETYPSDNPKRRKQFEEKDWSWSGAEQGSKYTFFVNVPNGYRNKGDLWPVILTVLPRGADYKTAMKDRYGDLLETHIVVASLEESVVGVARLTFHALMYAVLTYRVDRDRVVLDGIGRGSAVVDALAPDMPIQFAGAIFRSPSTVHALSGNIGLFPCLVEVPASPAAAVATAADAIAKARPDARVLRVRDGAGASAGEVLSREDADREIQKWIAALPPRAVSKAGASYSWSTTTEGAPQKWGYWFYTDMEVDRAPDLLVEVKYSLDPKYNLVDLECSNLASGTLLLNDEVLDLDYPVVVRVNGIPILRQKVVRSIDTVVRWAVPNIGDRILFVTAELPFEIPPEARLPKEQREALEEARKRAEEELAKKKAGAGNGEEPPPPEGGAAGEEKEKETAPPAELPVADERAGVLPAPEGPIPDAVRGWLEESRKAGRPLLLLFAAGDDAVAATLEKEVFPAESLAASLARFAVHRVATDGDGNAEMREFRKARFRDESPVLLGALWDGAHNLGRLAPQAAEAGNLTGEVATWLKDLLVHADRRLEADAEKEKALEGSGTDGAPPPVPPAGEKPDGEEPKAPEEEAEAGR